jgi:hypothetical protein
MKKTLELTSKRGKQICFCVKLQGIPLLEKKYLFFSPMCPATALSSLQFEAQKGSYLMMLSIEGYTASAVGNGIRAWKTETMILTEKSKGAVRKTFPVAQWHQVSSSHNPYFYTLSVT